MQRRTLGGTGIAVGDTALGTAMLGPQGGTTRDEGVQIVRAALDAGITLIDTADGYSDGISEEIVGAAIGGRRDEVVLSTKVGFPYPGTDDMHRGGSRRWIRRAVRASLRRLGTDHIDLYQLHRPDWTTSLDETLAAFDDLVREGTILAAGASMFPADLIVEGRWAAQRHGLRPFWTEQPRYSILNRTPEASVFPALQRHGMGALTFGPLAGGWLSGRADPTTGFRAGLTPGAFDQQNAANRAKFTAVEELTTVAGDLGVTMPALATAFVRAHPAVTSVIIGPRTREQLDGLLAGSDLVLDAATLDRIDEIVAPGTELNPDDNLFTGHPAIADPGRRRR